MQRFAQSRSGVVTVLCIACMLSGLNALSISRLSIPRWVLNGTDDGVVLDCEYVYIENDQQLVVKWYFNDDQVPFYQWIPELNTRHVSGIFRDRLDMDYSINPFDPSLRYRALRIRNPTTDMSGTYTCSVSSLASEDARQKEMTVYAPGKHFYFNVTEDEEENQVNISCIVDSVFPEPQMQLFYITSMKKHLLANYEPKNKTPIQNSAEGFEIHLAKSLDLKTIANEYNIFLIECQLEIPGSPYRRAKRITYVSGDKQ